jgi:hypothetical protein
MNETKTENTEHTEQHTGHEAVVVDETPKGPEMTADGLKLYPTSFLPQKSHMEPSRIPTAKMSGFEIEVAHVVIFFILTIGLFYSMWKRPNKR